MPLLRFILTALLALGALILAMFGALVVMVMGLLAALTGGKVRVRASTTTRPPPRPAPPPARTISPEGAIDVETTRVPDKLSGP